MRPHRREQQELTLDHAVIHGGVMRRLWPADMPAFRDHLLRLDSQSRFERFAMSVSDEFMSNYAERCFGIDDVIYGFFVDGVIRGAGELRNVGAGIIPIAGGAAEAAFSVEKPWRRRGIGTELMSRIVCAARNRRAQTLYMSCLAENVAMQGLAAKFNADLSFETDRETGRLIARKPDVVSLWREVIDDATGYATAVLDLQTRLFSMQGAGQR
jgi:GNAT superfamily N-acetyltransferase